MATKKKTAKQQALTTPNFKVIILDQPTAIDWVDRYNINRSNTAHKQVSSIIDDQRNECWRTDYIYDPIS